MCCGPVFALHQANPAAAPDEQEDVGSRLHLCQGSMLTTDNVHCLYHGAPQAVNNMHCGAVQVAAPQFRGDLEQRRSSGGEVASIGLAQTPSLRVPAQVSCAINCFVIHAQRVNVSEGI